MVGGDLRRKVLMIDRRTASWPDMRFATLPVLALLLLGAGACSTNHQRILPRQSLLARTRAGLEPPTSARASAVVSFAAAQIGKPYCWGGTGPGCFDCSGLTMWAYAQAGINLPHSSQAQFTASPQIDRGALAP